ncbi:biotin--[acetyl-CoA-carboxylase] ligase [Nitrosomonas sp. Is35]|uniref:biotin--[acetyl-CoA-carboxylase] ligase n=1 Tax=Nitrosomonas sp. Is35 TaxID=3080534 RepID=UPI00294B7887|nr:biotin--[acetyl-CoA-carboxylase] ligase [Nitrosomonas sp. Is35]MDV6347976.1 biotin--[acetyl-CoA-carboxylase] ligase [Nitrosomonas sp. Is35]
MLLYISCLRKFDSFDVIKINLLNRNKILEFIPCYSKIFNIKIFNIIDSTNNYLLNKFDKSEYNNNLIVVAASEIQFNGRGRENRKWYGGTLGNTLTFSILWRFEKGVSSLSGLSLVIGIVLVRVLRSFSDSNIYLKWPNDILHDNSKLAGILVELRGKIHGPSFAVIGIGINFHLPFSIKSHIQQKVTDLFQCTGKVHDRNEILGALLVQLYIVLSDFVKYGFSYFKNEWMSYHAYQGKNVTLLFPDNKSVVGVVDDVNDDGSICLITPNGKQSYNTGNISMRLKNN